MQNLILGVDVGQTNIKVTFHQGDGVVACEEVPTTEDVTSGIKTAIHNIVKTLPKDEELSITRLNLGANYFSNFLVQRSQLVPVSVVRLCGPATRALGPFDNFSDDVRELISGKCFYVNGGYQDDGSIITNLDEKEITEAIKEIKRSEIRNVVISGVFSCMKTDQEKQVGQLFAKHFPEASVTMSSDIGTIGLLEREHAAILNETLKPLCRHTVSALTQIVNELCLECPLFFTQNDGSFISSFEALQFPMRIMSSGSDNNKFEACHLSDIHQRIRENTIEPTVPFVDKATGEWILSEYDVHCISIGTGILGSGGGGPPSFGLLRALTTLRKGRSIRVIHPKRLKTNNFKDGKVGVAAFMGSPIVGIEKIPSGREVIEAIECIQTILKTDILDDNNKLSNV